MAKREHLKILRRGIEHWNRWRGENPKIRPGLSDIVFGTENFTGVDFSRANLKGATLVRTNLTGANFTGANIVWADLSESTLTGANFTRADLTWTKVFRAELPGVNLAEANLYAVNFSLSDLTGANLTGAQFHLTTLGDTDLTNTRGLDSCEHLGPSTIDHRTIMRSWPLPLAFLRGCGLPDTLIDYLPSLLNAPLEFYSCFISYSSSDQPFAERVHADLQNKGVRCWFAPHDIQGGKKIHEQIDQAIRVYDKLLLVLSENSMTSEWVKTEIANARQREIAETLRVLFPIRLVDFERIKNWKCFDADTGKDLAREIREYFIPDFSTWKDHDPYQQAFTRLLHDLKAEATEEQGKSPREG